MRHFEKIGLKFHDNDYWNEFRKVLEIVREVDSRAQCYNPEFKLWYHERINKLLSALEAFCSGKQGYLYLPIYNILYDNEVTSLEKKLLENGNWNHNLYILDLTREKRQIYSV